MRAPRGTRGASVHRSQFLKEVAQTYVIFIYLVIDGKAFYRGTAVNEYWKIHFFFFNNKGYNTYEEEGMCRLPR